MSMSLGLSIHKWRILFLNKCFIRILNKKNKVKYNATKVACISTETFIILTEL